MLRSKKTIHLRLLLHGKNQLQTQPPGSYVPPVPPPAPKEQKQEHRQNLHEFLTRQAAADGEGSVFAQEFLRRHGIVDGRASP